MFASTLKRTTFVIIQNFKSRPVLQQFNNYGCTHKVLAPNSYQLFSSGQRPPLRREDFLKENEKLSQEENKQAKHQEGKAEQSDRQEARSYNRGEDDGKRAPQDLSEDHSKTARDFTEGGSGNASLSGDKSRKPKYAHTETTKTASPSDSPQDWAKITGHDKSETGKRKFSTNKSQNKSQDDKDLEEKKKTVKGHPNKVADKFNEKIEDLKEGAEELRDKVVEKGEKIIENAKEAVKSATDKLKK